MKSKKRVRKLFASNPVLLGVSLLLSVALWLGVTVTVAPEEERVFPRVPVVLDIGTENTDLEAFIPPEGLFVGVTVSGKRYVVNEITPEEISVRASSPGAGIAGLRSLRLNATNISGYDFKILPLAQQEISVLFDERKEHEFQLESVIINENGILLDKKNVAPKGYFVDHELLSINKVTLSGPASEIARVSSVTATAQVSEKITDTRAFIASIAAQTRDSSPLNFVTIQADDEISMTIPVYKRVRLPITVDWLNVPPAYAQKPFRITANPKEAEFGISESLLEDVSSVNVGTIDFARLPAGKQKKFTFPAAEILQYRLLSNIESFAVTVDTSDKVREKFAVAHQNIQMLNAAEGTTARVVSGELAEVSVVGSPKSIDSLDSSDIFAEVDLAGVKPGERTVPARVFVKGHDDCWVYGTYDIRIEVGGQ